MRRQYVQAHPELVGDARRDALRPADLARLSSAELDALAREWGRDGGDGDDDKDEGDGGDDDNKKSDSGGVLGLYRDALDACQARIAELSARCE